MSAELREYLAFIGGRGGQASRRWLSRTHARQMVAIREAKRRLRKEGKWELAQKRVALPKYEPSPIHRRPSVRPKRMIGTIGSDSL